MGCWSKHASPKYFKLNKKHNLDIKPIAKQRWREFGDCEVYRDDATRAALQIISDHGVGTARLDDSGEARRKRTRSTSHHAPV
jgi:hypothetical protein